MADNRNERPQAVASVGADLTARRVEVQRLPDFIDFGNGVYHCMTCGATAEELSALSHEPDCPYGA